MCKFPTFLTFHYIFNGLITSKYPIITFCHYVQVPYLFTFHQIFSVPLCASSPSFYLSLFFYSVPLCASSPSFYIPLYLQCPIVGKFPIYLHSIRSSVSHSGQVPNNFVLHYIFSVPLCASSLSFYLSLYLQCPILGKFPIYLHSIRSSVSHFGQVPYLFTFHYIFSVPFGASSLSIYIPLDLQCPIMCKFPNFLCFVISSVSHSGQVPYSFTFHYIFSLPLCASSPYFYISFYIQCPILCKFPNFLCFVISSVSHCGQVPNNFVLHYIFSVPFWASSLSIYIPLDLQCPILGKFPIYLHFIISLVSHLGQVPYLFTFHQIFSVPLCACSLSFYLSLYLQFPIMCKFPILFSLYLQCPILGKYPIVLRFIISSVSHYVQVLHIFTFHSIFSVPFCASSLTSYVSLYLQCPILGKYPIVLRFIISSVSHYVQVLHIFTFHYISSSLFLCFVISSVSHSGQVPNNFVPLYIQCPIMCKFPIFLPFIISFVYHYVQVLLLFTIHYIFSVPFWASTPQLYVSLFLQCPIMCKLPIFLPFIISFVYHYVQVLLLFTFHYMFSVPLCASSPSFYIPLYLQCPILGKFPIYLHFIISLVSHFGQVPYLFTFHQIFSVPFWASSLSIYISLYLQCPILGKFPIYLHSIRSSVSHFGQVPYLFTFHQIFSVPLCASSPSFYIPLYLLCPILGKYPIALRFIISSVSHYVPVLHIFTFHFVFSVQLCGSSQTSYVSLYLQCPILGKYPIVLRFIISSVSHYVQVLHIFTFHSIFSVPFCASSLTSYVSLYLQCPILGKYPIILCFIYLVSHYVQVPYLFTFHQIFSVPLCASSPIFSISLYLQCPILGKFPIYLHSIRSSVSHYVQVLHFFPFHYIFSVPFWASSLSIYIPLDIQCPILGKFPIYLHSIRSSVSHYVHVPYLFTFHYIFSFPLCASSLTSYISLYLQCPILGKYPIVLRFIISSVSHYVQVLHIFTFHSIFSVPFCASSLTSYVSLYLQCPIVGKYPIILCFIIYLVSHYVQVPYLFTFHQIFSVPLCASSPFFYHFIISLVSHFGQVPYLFTFHQIFSVPFWASSLSIYISLYLQCPILGKFPIYLHFIISSVSDYVQVHYLFTFHYIFSVPFCASSLTSYVSLYLQCPILGKYPIILCFIIYLVSHYVQVPYLFTFHYIFSFPLCASSLLFMFHYIFSVPFWASTLQFYVSLYLQCPIMSKYPLILCFIIYLVSHYVQVLHLFTFHYFFSVPFWESTQFYVSSLQCPIMCKFSIFYISFYIQCPILCKFPIYLHSIISLVSHLGQVPYLFTFHQIFSVPLCASSPYFYISFYIQCPILCKFPNFLCFVISSVSHSGQVPNNFVLHYIFSVPLCASSLSFYLSLFPLCTIMCKFSFFLPSIICSVSHYVQVLHLFTFHYIFSVPFGASSLSIYIPLDLQCPILGKYPIVLRFIISSVSHYVQVLHIFTFHSIFSVPFCASSLTSYVSLYLQCPIVGKYPIILCFIIYLVSHYVQVPYLFTFYISRYVH